MPDPSHVLALSRVPVGVLADVPSLSDRVTSYVVGELTSGGLRLGQRVNEVVLARKLGISRNPIREALSGLEQRGILVAHPRRGMFVRLFSAADVDDLFAFRICIETFAIRQAVPRMTEADVKRIASLVNRMARGAVEHDVPVVREADLGLHYALCALSGSQQALRTFEVIRTEVFMLTASVDEGTETLDACVRDHMPLLEAIKARDVDGAAAALEAHLRHSWRNVGRPGVTGRDADTQS